MTDIYFEENYGKLYEQMDKGEASVFLFQSEKGTVRHQYIKRQIPEELLPDKYRKVVGGSYYDIVTPYGYGGPVILDAEEADKEKVAGEFFQAFSAYCRQENIVAEFIRFHPLVQNALDFQKEYAPIWDRNTLGTNLKDYDDPVGAEFTRHCRKHIRQALNKGVSWKITESPEDLQSFRQVYDSTMERNHASEYYFFNDAYFEKCLQYFGRQLLLIEACFEGKVIAAGIYFLSGKTIHIHLSGTLEEYLYLSPAYVLRYALTCWGKEHGYEMIHHGGGRSNSAEDALFLFKKQFAVNTKFDFYIGKKIWMPELYQELCRYNKVDEKEQYFPAYRR